ncbi:MAG: sortase [Herpetosiphonaceae bacterium]|nr:MAG: sortase [Herpetosiphonaceae bacterium]
MIRQQAALQSEHRQANSSPAGHRPLSWTLGNLLLLSGLYLLLYVGGLYANATYEQWAARGDNDLQPAAVEALAPSAPNAFVLPALNQPEEITASSPTPTSHQSTVSRLIIPKIGVDSKVIEVGWETIQENGREVSVWKVAKYAVGQHKGSANPGEGSNIVLAGHVGGEAPVFKDLIQLEPGDQLTIYSAGRQYLYVVQEKVLVQEAGVSDDVRLQNARYIAPTDDEVVTLITCWPPTGPHQFDQRLIIRAAPYGSDAADSAEFSGWTLR